MKLTIIVPSYNEAQTLPSLIKRFNTVLAGNPEIDVLIVNNGSSDNTNEILTEFMSKHSFLSSVTVPINKGYGFGIVSGLKKATGDFIGWTHADMQTDPADIIKAYNILYNEKFDKNLYIKGDRKKRPIFDQFFTLGMSIYESIYLKTKLWDINAQPNVFHRSFFERLDFFPDDFSLDLYIYYKAIKSNLKIVRFPVLFTQRLHGESKWNKGDFDSKKKFIKRTLDFSKNLKNSL